MELAIAALLSHRSVEDAARAVGVTTHTLLRWMKQSAFRAMYQQARQLAFSQALGRLQEASGAAVTTTLKIMFDTNAPPGIRLRAAQIVLEQAARAAELENLRARDLPRTGESGAVTATVLETTPLLGSAPTPGEIADPANAGKEEVKK
jgi:transposase-like protein